MSTLSVARVPATPLLVAVATGTIGCGGLVPFAGAGGPFPLDSARAVAVAQRNVCGRSMPPSDTTCVVREYHRNGGRHWVTLDRRPPAGNDRVVVTLLGNGSIEVAPVDSATRKP